MAHVAESKWIYLPPEQPDGRGKRPLQPHSFVVWPAPGSEDTELGVLMELEVGHGETEVYPRVQA
jgi:hypothetical protein